MVGKEEVIGGRTYPLCKLARGLHPIEFLTMAADGDMLSDVGRFM